MSHIPGLRCLCSLLFNCIQSEDGGQDARPPTAAGIVAVDAGDWTAAADLLSWFGLSQDTPASRYDCGATWWAVLDPKGAMICHSWIKDAHGIERLAEPGMTAILGNTDLSAIDGPLATPVDETSVSEDGGQDARPPSAMGEVFASAKPIGGLTSRTLKPGYARVATLTLNVAGQPGVYSLILVDGQYFDDAEVSAPWPMTAGPAFEIRVGGE